MCLIIHIVPFYSYKFWNMGIQGNENSFFTCYLKVVLDRFFWNLEFVPDDSISHYSSPFSQRFYTIGECKSLTLSIKSNLHYKRDSCTQLFFSDSCRIFKNNFVLEHSWASASDFIFDIYKSSKYMKWVFYEPFFTEKVKQSKKAEWL